jgi:hypothetical protein
MALLARSEQVVQPKSFATPMEFDKTVRHYQVLEEISV